MLPIQGVTHCPTGSITPVFPQPVPSCWFCCSPRAPAWEGEAMAGQRLHGLERGLGGFWQPHTQTGAGAPTCQPPDIFLGWKHQQSWARSH